MAEFLLILPILLLSIVAHEYAHAWAAYKQGDTTAWMLGRLTFNPIPHIDPWMSIIVPIGLYLISHGTFTFGAAKPVPVNPRNYRHYRRGDIIVSTAGIAMNIAIGIICAGAFVLIGVLGRSMPVATLALLQRMAANGIWINILLAGFNLVPIPPLDGSHVFYHILPPALGARYREFGRYGFAVLMLLMWFVPGASNILLWPVIHLSDAALGALNPWSLEAMR